MREEGETSTHHEVDDSTALHRDSISVVVLVLVLTWNRHDADTLPSRFHIHFHNHFLFLSVSVWVVGPRWIHDAGTGTDPNILFR